MTKAEKLHYLKGGKFNALFNPVKRDMTDAALHLTGKRIVVYQNVLNTPMENGQFRFNSENIYGYFYEEDISNLEMLDEYIDNPEPTTQYCYRITYLNEASLVPNFGKGNWKAPMTVTREYDTERDNYVLNHLSNPKADLVEKRLLNLLDETESSWEKIYPYEIKSRTEG